MLACPSGWPYRPGEAPVLGVALAPRFARADVAGSSHGGASPLLPTRMAPPGRRCSRRSAPRERRVRRMPVGSGQAFRRCAQGEQSLTPATPVARDRSPADRANVGGGIGASNAWGRSPGALLRHGCRRSRWRARPGHGGCPRGVPSLGRTPVWFPRGLAPQEGTRGSWGKRFRRGGSHGSGPSRGGADGSARWRSPRRRVPCARHGSPPHPAVPCRTGGMAVARAAIVRGAGAAPPGASGAAQARPSPSAGLPGERGSGGAAERRSGGDARGCSPGSAPAGPPGRRSFRRATAHPGRSRAHRRAGGVPLRPRVDRGAL